LAKFKVPFSIPASKMHAVIKIIFYIDHIKNTDNGLAAILVMQISKCNVISGYEHVAPLGHIILIPGATSGAGTAYSSGTPEFTPGFYSG
jgi:hypothetical protein